MPANQGCAQIFEKKTFPNIFFETEPITLIIFLKIEILFMRIARKKNLFLYALF